MVFLGGQQAEDAVQPIARVLEKQLMAVQSTQREQRDSAGRGGGRGEERGENEEGEEEEGDHDRDGCLHTSKYLRPG